jgi:hypothetical protein
MVTRAGIMTGQHKDGYVVEKPNGDIKPFLNEDGANKYVARYGGKVWFATLTEPAPKREKSLADLAREADLTLPGLEDIDHE